MGGTKNPCKICLQTVTRKNGLQCHGVCKKWVHYACLKYSAGKVKDIKKGYIKVSCPCPDCVPDQKGCNDPHHCNHSCPTNNVTVCTSTDVASTRVSNKKSVEAANKVSDREFSDKNESGNSLSYTSEDLSSILGEVNLVDHTRVTIECVPNNSLSESCFRLPNRNVGVGVCKVVCTAKTSASDSLIFPNTEPSRNDRLSMVYTLQQMCKTVGILSHQIRELMMRMTES